MNYFVVSDVHGFYDELLAALNKAGFENENKNHALLICGDLFDRGSKSPQLFEFVKRLKEQNRLIYVRGNHEDLLCDLYSTLLSRASISYHHYTNGTVGTVCQFLSKDHYKTALGIYHNRRLVREDIECIKSTIKPIIDWINDNTVDYAAIGDCICVHGWIPHVRDEENLRDVTKAEWERARWRNGMDEWASGWRFPNKTIICGHWHCSYGNEKFHNKEEDYSPFVDSGIVAIDACTALTHKVNCIVLEVDDNDETFNGKKVDTRGQI